MILDLRNDKKYAATRHMRAGQISPICRVIPTGNMEQFQDEYKAGPV